jgi:hypothetical protein
MRFGYAILGVRWRGRTRHTEASEGGIRPCTLLIRPRVASPATYTRVESTLALGVGRKQGILAPKRRPRSHRGLLASRPARPRAVLQPRRPRSVPQGAHLLSRPGGNAKRAPPGTWGCALCEGLHSPSSSRGSGRPRHSIPSVRWRSRTYPTIAASCSSLRPSTSGMSPKSQWCARTPRRAASRKAASAWWPGR